ncbi:HAMP domain-containing histidine kinase [Alkalicaulis satelles]|uniref:histidine kinase n=1 Tax=Alkalicaulis satelles TaxID=2609175 RepID=A0A5M6ZLV1_9PROT|nr:HAMP domain-containing histidine kinase [Alkalicaulis satelles]
MARWLDRAAGPAIHGAWLAACAAVIWMLAPLELAGWAFALAALAPGLIGLVLGARLDREGGRAVMALAWCLPGLSASMAFASALSPAALVFLAGPAALAASGSERAARLSAVLSACAFVMAAGFSLMGPPAGSQLPLGALSGFAVLAAFFALTGVTARARLLGRLKAARREAEALRPAADGFAHAPAPLLMLDEAGVITAASRAVRRAAPGAPRDLTGLPAEGLGFDGDQGVRLSAALHEARQGGGADGGRFSFTVRGPRGRESVLSARAVATPAGFVVSLDEPAGADAETTARLAAERDAAIAASRAKSEFLAAVSHELRTPLNAIIGFSDVMKQRLFGPLPARYAEYGDLIHESGRHLLELIGDVLDMSKIEADRYELVTEVFDVRDVADICAKMMRLRASEKGVTLHLDAGDAPIHVHADRKALRQVLLNLLSNAVKFTPDGGAVALMARRDGGDLLLAVGDSGVGISSEEIDRLGQPYAQSQSGRESAERSSGLGLVLVRQLAALHGGVMEIDSEPGEGTTVTVRLPVLVNEAGEPAGAVEPLEVHQRIRAAQAAGAELARTGEGAA